MSPSQLLLWQCSSRRYLPGSLMPQAPRGVHYDAGLMQYLLPYEFTRRAKDPDAAVTDFF